MPAKLTARRCYHCSRPFRPATFHSRYCRPVCRDAARRVRDRERKIGLGTVPASAFADGGYQRRHVEGKCAQCGRHRELRYDFYGPAGDAMLDSPAVFCNAACAARWWRAQATGPGPDDVCDGLRQLIYPARGRQAESAVLDDDDQDDPEDDWDLGDDDDDDLWDFGD